MLGPRGIAKTHAMNNRATVARIPGRLRGASHGGLFPWGPIQATVAPRDQCRTAGKQGTISASSEFSRQVALSFEECGTRAMESDHAGAPTLPVVGALSFYAASRVANG
jgi:hypothetical protein